MNEGSLKVTLENDRRVLRLTLASPATNIVDIELLEHLKSALLAQQHQGLCAVLIQAEGPNFSYGASIQEHLPDKVSALLTAMHGLVLTMVAYPVPILVAVRGQCLGGGLEIACAGNLLFASEDAQFGQPEIKLGVFAPVASVLLPERIGPARAEDLLFSGRSIDAPEALGIGLINAIEREPEQAALEYMDTYLLQHSRFALHQAVKAARLDTIERVTKKIEAVEKQYLHELMKGGDPVEGLTAFLEKRPPVWKDR